MTQMLVGVTGVENKYKYISFLFEISKLQTVASGGMMQKVCLFPKNCLAADGVEDVEHLQAQVIPSFKAFGNRRTSWWYFHDK